jgi:RimJ/RimL family protein N-acetyltransferase
MTDFSPRIPEYWQAQFAGDALGPKSCTVNPSLSHKRPAMILTRDGAPSQMTVRPELAACLGQLTPKSPSIEDRRAALIRSGIAFHDPDHLFYLPEDEPIPTPARSARKLTPDDRSAFDIFHYEAPEADHEDAFVEWDHWAVFGCFDGDRLISAASAILWENSPFADLGVLTLPDARGKGAARAVVMAMLDFVRGQGLEPQYRCQVDNSASVALATACGLRLYGQWIVAAEPASPCHS